MAKRQSSILVVGGRGFIGAKLAGQLSKSGKKVIVTSRTKGKVPAGTRLAVGDLMDARFCRRIAKDASTIFYLAAAKKNIAHHTNKPYDFVRGNILPLLSFLDALQNEKPGTFIYVSSALVAYAMDESEAADGYILGKLACEHAVNAFAKQTGWHVSIVRSTAVYGPGDSFDPAVANFIPSIIQRIKTSEKELSIWGRGLRKLQFIYVDDLVENLIAIGRSHTTGTFTIGNPEVMSVNQIAKLVIDLMGKKLALKHDLSKADKETKLSRFKNIKVPRVNLKEGLKRTIKASTV